MGSFIIAAKSFYICLSFLPNSEQRDPFVLVFLVSNSCKPLRLTMLSQYWLFKYLFLQLMFRITPES